MMLIAGVMFIFLGFFTKFAAILSTLPTPIIGSILGVSLSIVGGVGLSSIKLIDAGSSRNIAILGLSIMSGMVIPMYVAEHPIETGSEAVDQMLQIVLSIEMLVGGIIGFTLDNTVPGTRAERGLATEEVEDCSKTDSLYGFSDGIMNRLRLCPLITYLPILPRLSTTND
uniref:Uncharacterized protein n=1 Tax=Plectus sambesii TaxID=2011161 RepID=A0A914UQJ6_9BILA